jgi:O-acetylhomoserine/O-acetylserine sulfhydrylase-like pyridoxal-dependent enzyme
LLEGIVVILRDLGQPSQHAAQSFNVLRGLEHLQKRLNKQRH